jgi:hypothetical protein
MGSHLRRVGGICCSGGGDGTTGDANWVSKALVALVKAAWRRLRRVTAPMKVDMMVINFYEDRGLMGWKRKSVPAVCGFLGVTDRRPS